jgi:hypothetical protein
LNLTDPLNIRVNPNAKIRQHPINEDLSAIVVDDFLLNPDEIIEHASNSRVDFEAPPRNYPGEVLDLNAIQFPEVTQYIRSRLSKIFSFVRGDFEDSCQISLTTLQPEKFSWIQRLPHEDPLLDPLRVNIALMVYLFDNPDLGGTGFYRYRDKKFWHSMVQKQIDDPDGGLSIVQTRYDMFLEPSKYPGDSDQAVELLTMIPARFNRMICYPGKVPHSAYIPDASLLTNDCKKGRLTLNSFASVWPKKN